MDKKLNWIKAYGYPDEYTEVIYITKDKRFRIVQIVDPYPDVVNDHCETIFSPYNHPQHPIEKLYEMEIEFRNKAHKFGSYGLGLEQCHPDDDEPEYCLIHQCYGFFGWEKFNGHHHYIKELKKMAENLIKRKVA